MLEIQAPFSIKGIPLKPEMKGRLKVDETLIQTLSAIMGWNGEARRLITCSLSGSLHTVTPVVTGLQNIVAGINNYHLQFPDSPVTEIMMRADSSNSGTIWIMYREEAFPDVGWPLDGGDMLRFSVNNMKDFEIDIKVSGDKLVIMRAG